MFPMTSPKSVNGLSTWPDDVILIMSTYLHVRTLNSLSKVDKHLYELMAPQMRWMKKIVYGGYGKFYSTGYIYCYHIKIYWYVRANLIIIKRDKRLTCTVKLCMGMLGLLNMRMHRLCIHILWRSTSCHS
jgi:hypothetical protein